MANCHTDVYEWLTIQVTWLMSHLCNGADPNEEYLYDSVEMVFTNAFTDTMSVQRVKAEFQDVKMEQGNLDTYVSKFECLACLSGYGLDSSFILNKFSRGLVPGLYAGIVNSPDDLVTWTNWVCSAQWYQQKYLLVQSNLEDRQGGGQKKHMKEQWQQAFKAKPKDPNAMDTTPGRVHAHQITTDKREKLMKEGKCFTCQWQGHLSHNCPKCLPQTNVRASTLQEQEQDKVEEALQPAKPAKARAGKTKYSADEIIEIMWNTEDGDKDEVIQKVFMAPDF